MRQYWLVIFIFFLQLGFAQQPLKPNSLEIHEAIQKLNFFGNVMYVAAHPDDENTRLISYFSKHYHAHTTYVSITRGDGGQNLIGADLNEKLGLIRTQELLQARKIDGGHQLFTRAIDFGYSKTPEETLSTWNKEEVLADLVFAIRLNRPDIIINRFDHRTAGTTHGHHTSSAVLAMEAFDLASKKDAYPEQLQYVEIWQPKVIYFNDSWFFYRNREDFNKADHSNHLQFNIGEYYADLGLANNEIAALSRSMHKSQGFGNTGSRGDQVEYLELLKGELPDSKNVFSHIETGWDKLNAKNANQIEKLLNEVEDDFNFQKPSLSLPKLLEAYQLLSEANDSYWKTRKIQDLEDIIISCSGLFIEAITKQAYSNPGKEIQVYLEATNQSEAELNLASVTILGNNTAGIQNAILLPNQKNEWEVPIEIPQNQKWSNPFWLEKEPGKALYTIDEIAHRNLPKLENKLAVQFNLVMEGQQLQITRNLVYKYNDPVAGEVYENFMVLPSVSLTFEKEILVFSENKAKQVDLEIVNYGVEETVQIQIETQSGWTIEPASFEVDFSNPNESKKVTLQITPPKQASEFTLTAKALTSTDEYASKVEIIDYPHFTKQSLIQPNQLKLFRLDVQTKGKKVAYIQGAGDEVATAISELGYDVELLQVSSISKEKINGFDTVVIGIRAFNIAEEMDIKKDILFNYVAEGGNLIVQYNTSRGLQAEISPLPLELSRNRVTDEFAEVNFLAPEHPILNDPNQITSKDFEYWVQERGLYFPKSWDSAFTPILGMHDPNEALQKGSLVTTKYGKGYYTYTGLSFFRQLPAGVVGAYRLFANLLSLGNE